MGSYLIIGICLVIICSVILFGMKRMKKKQMEMSNFQSVDKDAKDAKVSVDQKETIDDPEINDKPEINDERAESTILIEAGKMNSEQSVKPVAGIERKKASKIKPGQKQRYNDKKRISYKKASQQTNVQIKHATQVENSNKKNIEGNIEPKVSTIKRLQTPEEKKAAMLLEQEEAALFVQWVEQKQIGKGKDNDSREYIAPAYKGQKPRQSHIKNNVKISDTVSAFLKTQGLRANGLKCVRSVEQSETVINIDIDFHGYTLAEVKQIMAQMTRIKGKQEIQLHCIHGYTQGTVIRDYLRVDFKHPRLKQRFYYSTNEGQTDLILTPLN